jgi:hypothetical protein
VGGGSGIAYSRVPVLPNETLSAATCLPRALRSTVRGLTPGADDGGTENSSAGDGSSSLKGEAAQCARIDRQIHRNAVMSTGSATRVLPTDC